MAIDPAGRLLLVGTDAYPARSNARLFDADHLSPLGEVVPLQTAKPRTEQPYLASARPGQFLMVWEAQGAGRARSSRRAARHRTWVSAWSRAASGWRSRGATTRATPARGTRCRCATTPAPSGSLRPRTSSFSSRSSTAGASTTTSGCSTAACRTWNSTSASPTRNGDVQLYHNPAGTLASHADVQAFPPAPGTDPPGISTAAALRGGILQISAPLSPPIFCHSSEGALCLDPLYRVTVDFVDPETGDTKQARAVPFSQESGAFWFFSPENLELFVKVLDGSGRHRPRLGPSTER